MGAGHWANGRHLDQSLATTQPPVAVHLEDSDFFFFLFLFLVNYVALR